MYQSHEHYMQIALNEAAKGQGKTSPNPCVGAVIVNNDKIVGLGYHKKCGTPHAEINAIRNAGSFTRKATLYVTLEPCNHTGKTPPCSQAILKAGIKKVVVGTKDPNPGVQGGGNTFLMEKGLDVTVGILEKQCRTLIRPFVKHSINGLPWVTMKAGMSLDGKICYKSGSGGKITGDVSRRLVHKMRNQYDAILIGVQTALIDNPSLTTRFIDNGRDPIRVIVDTNLRIPCDAKLFHQHSSAPTWIFCSQLVDEKKVLKLEKQGAVIKKIACDPGGQLDLYQLLLSLGKNNVLSVLVEGGAAIHGSMLKQKFVDEVYLFIAPFFIGSKGTSVLSNYFVEQKGQSVNLLDREIIDAGDDFLVRGLVNYYGEDIKSG